MNIGNTIKQLRKKAGLRQSELADRANITQSYLSQIENNHKEPNLSTLESISEQLNVPLPILIFLSLDSQDIPEEKKSAYEAFFPKMKALIDQELLLEIE